MIFKPGIFFLSILVNNSEKSTCVVDAAQMDGCMPLLVGTLGCVHALQMDGCRYDGSLTAACACSYRADGEPVPDHAGAAWTVTAHSWFLGGAQNVTHVRPSGEAPASVTQEHILLLSCCADPDRVVGSGSVQQAMLGAGPGPANLPIQAFGQNFLKKYLLATCVLFCLSKARLCF